MTDNLVSVETQNEYSITSGKRETRIFIKLYVDAIHNGLLADMGDELFCTLLTIAAFMDERGQCYPTQDMIAQRLGISRQTAGRRIKKLLEYRWNGRPVIHATKTRENDSQRFDSTRYTVLPISQITIFDKEPEQLE